MRLPPLRTLLAAGMIVATSLVGSSEAMATEAPIAVGEVSAPPASSGVDSAGVRDMAEVEIRQIDLASLRDHRRFVVSFALTNVVGGAVACTVNAMIRDAKTGAMIAIIEAGARAEGPASAEVRKQVALGAVRRAVRRIPSALGIK